MAQGALLEKIGAKMRLIRRKSDGKTEKQWPHLIHGQWVYLPINNFWEVVE